MSDRTDFTPDDVLGFEFDADPVTGEETDVLTVTFTDGTERKFQGAEADWVRQLLQNFSPPSA